MNDVIVFLGIALFFIMVAIMFYLIMQTGSITATIGIIIGTVAICALGFAAAIALSSTLEKISPQGTYINITNVSLCDNYDMPCTYSAFPYDNNVTIYWEVNNGIGCCATYNCNYTQFSNACLTPTFKLYNIYFDNNKYIWTPINLENYEYNCTNKTPYNYFYYENVSLGEHTIKIEQKDCTDKILATASITFLLSQIEDIYTIEVLQ